jgi:hypothetical protein
VVPIAGDAGSLVITGLFIFYNYGYLKAVEAELRKARLEPEANAFMAIRMIESELWRPCA